MKFKAKNDEKNAQEISNKKKDAWKKKRCKKIMIESCVVNKGLNFCKDVKDHVQFFFSCFSLSVYFTFYM